MELLKTEGATKKRVVTTRTFPFEQLHVGSVNGPGCTAWKVSVTGSIPGEVDFLLYTVEHCRGMYAVWSLHVYTREKKNFCKNSFQVGVDQ